jgi:hypothetical protein
MFISLIGDSISVPGLAGDAIQSQLFDLLANEGRARVLFRVVEANISWSQVLNLMLGQNKP